MLKKATDILRHLDFSISPFFVHAKGHPEKVPDDRHYFAVAEGFLWSHIFFFSLPKSFLKSVLNSSAHIIYKGGELIFCS